VPVSLTITLVLTTALSFAAGMIWVERRLLGVLQDRKGPNRVGPFGVLQPVADAIKLLTKSDWIPPFADAPLFVLAPTLVMATALMSLAVVPFAPGVGVVSHANVGLLFVLAMTSLSVYGVVLAGWASSSRYSLLGAMRAAAQLVSYEIFMGLSLGGVVILAGSFDLGAIVEAQRGLWNVVKQPVGFVVFYVAALAETHRLPFDLPEAESELVAGYHSEYSSMKFGLFFVGEYVAIGVASALVTVLFLGGWHGPLFPPIVWFGLKTLLVAVSFVVLRGSLPRPRYDQLMGWGYKFLFPVALINLLVTGALELLLSP